MTARAQARRAVIREILARKTVMTQDALRRQLASRGIRAAQATLSRDMVALGVRRANGVGGRRYVFEGDSGALPIEPVQRMVETIATNGALVVVRTKGGAASPVARALDEAHLPDLLGTVAGDDTVLVVPSTTQGGHALARRLRRLLHVS
ncbi:MAG TPA: arginine repressor [Polyangia bacterium]|nr:arginine repressor [Polyangia bacterium]